MLLFNSDGGLELDSQPGSTPISWPAGESRPALRGRLEDQAGEFPPQASEHDAADDHAGCRGGVGYGQNPGTGVVERLKDFFGAHAVSGLEPADDDGRAAGGQADNCGIEANDDEPYQNRDGNEVNEIFL